MAIAADLGVRARVDVADPLATAAAFGERGGRVVTGVEPARVADLRRAAREAGVAAAALGVVAGDELDLQFGSVRIVSPGCASDGGLANRLLGASRSPGGSLRSTDAVLRASARADAHRGDDRILLESHATTPQRSAMKRGGHVLVGGGSARRKSRAAVGRPRFDPAPSAGEQDIQAKRASPASPPIAIPNGTNVGSALAGAVSAAGVVAGFAASLGMPPESVADADDGAPESTATIARTRRRPDRISRTPRERGPGGAWCGWCVARDRRPRPDADGRG